MDRFPKDFGNELSGLTFDELFEKHPKWIEYVADMWTDDCTGIFKRLREYVLLRMQDPISRSEHEARCVAFVKNLPDVPPYLLKYDNARKSPPRI